MMDVLVCGAGRIGMAVASFLVRSDKYRVHLADIDFAGEGLQEFLRQFDEISTVAMDVRDSNSLIEYFSRHQIKAVISCLPSDNNPHVAIAAREMTAHYFDLGENIHIAQNIREIAQGADSAFVVDCGCAPGFVGVIAHDLLQQFDTCIAAEVRVGALQQSPNSPYDVAADCSVNQIITEYSNPCTRIDKKRLTEALPLRGLETIEIEGQTFEAFYTAGGLGHLIPAYEGKIERFDYKSIHFQGHREKMDFLLQGLHLKDDSKLLKQVLHHAAGVRQADQILIAVTTRGILDGETVQREYYQRLLPMQYGGMELSAVQCSTAAGVCSIFDEIMQAPEAYQGLVAPEIFSLATLLANPFASYYAGR